MATEIWVNIGSSNDLLPDSNKPRASENPRGQRAVLKQKFWNEWMNEKTILGLKLCTETQKIFFKRPEQASSWTCVIEVL